MSETDTEIDTDARARPGLSWQVTMLVATALLGVAVMGALITILSNANRQRDAALTWQTHSFDVMILARTLSGTVARAEAALGRYVISGDRQLGVIYNDEWENAGAQIDRLASLTRDSDRQQAQMDEVRRAYTDRGNELAQIALSTRYEKNAQALALYYRARSSPSLKQLDTMLDKVIDLERQLLSQRTEEARRLAARSGEIVRWLIGFGIALVVGTIALGWLTVTVLARRQLDLAETEAERERAQKLQAAVTEATAELRQQAAERQAAEEKLRQGQKMEAVGQLTGGIAHDFNNMLAVVLGGLELAKRRMSTTHPALRHIENATEGANRAATLTRRLLSFSRAEALLPTAIEPADLISGMVDLLDRTLGDAIAIETSVQSSDWHIWADRHQIENAILNLAVNARDAMDGRGTLAIRAGGQVLRSGEIGQCKPGDYVTICVTDTGIGMTPDVLERVFEPFFTTKPVGKGTGLGLSQIFGFVRQSQGEITIVSRVGEGTAVTLFLPRHNGCIDAPAQPDTLDAGVASARPQTLNVLVVEDDPRVLQTSVEGLAALGHIATACGDPLAALAMLDRDGPFDLIISDVLMPGQTGPELIAEVRARHPELAVLFVTGFAGEAGGAEEFGGHAVLRKPFTLAALDRAIAKAVAVSRSASPVLAAE
ncbi:MAG: ATP-binding protein [Sphingomonas sp.]